MERLEEQTSLLVEANVHSTADTTVDSPTATDLPARARSALPAISRAADSNISSVAAARWREATSVLLARRFVHRSLDASHHSPGAAPGVDPRRNKYHHLAAKWCLPVTVTMVDYDAREVNIHPKMNCAEQLEALLAQPRDDSRKNRVRWIHVDGLNWEVIQVLALKYDLHPLALEDTVHVPQRIKADFYDCCLYVSLIYLYLARADADGDAGPGPNAASSTSTPSRRLYRTISSARRAELEAANAGDDEELFAAGLLPWAFDGDGDGESGSSTAKGTTQHRRSRPTSRSGPGHFPLPLRNGSATGGCAATAAHGGAAAGSGAAKGGSRGGGFFGGWSGGGRNPGRRVGRVRGSGGVSAIHVSAQQVSLFLLRGEHPNTLITVFQSDGSPVAEPILEQLREPRTLVREAEDASFLANLVIDTLVDHIFPVLGAYREQLQAYEQDVTGGGTPSAAATRELHAMQRDLRRLDRTIAPLQVVVSNIVSRDATTTRGDDFPPPASAVASRAASATHAAIPAPPGAFDPTATPSSAPHRLPSSSPSPPPHSRPPPFLSRLACTYLNDVRDHVATICEDLMSLSAECGDLIGLIFNLTALQQSTSTQALTVVSTIFLPITFLAGVYGMNFDQLPELHWPYGYAYFWVTSAVIVLVFMAVMKRAGMWWS